MRIRIPMVMILAGVILVFWTISCGPSLRRTHQSDNAFARCFDMDYNPGAKRRHKTKCWKTWLGDYVYNQPEDKTAYAELRLEEIAKGVSVPGPPGKPGSFDKRPKPEAAPANDPMPPTPEPEPSVQPPPVEPQTEEPIAAEPAPAPPMDPDCEPACKDAHTVCLEDCGEEAGPETRCSNACIKLYTGCMKKCLN